MKLLEKAKELTMQERLIRNYTDKREFEVITQKYVNEYLSPTLTNDLITIIADMMTGDPNLETTKSIEFNELYEKMMMYPELCSSEEKKMFRSLIVDGLTMVTGG